MRTAFGKRLFIVWLVLSAISVGYVWIDHSADDHGAPTADTAVTISAIALALIKVRIIMREFMEVRGAPALLRQLTDVLVAVMAVGLLGMYLAGKAVA